MDHIVVLLGHGATNQWIFVVPRIFPAKPFDILRVFTASAHHDADIVPDGVAVASPSRHHCKFMLKFTKSQSLSSGLFFS
jgi:hypothetical protein